jgi:lauroyl/myristoyl acyltransferase
MNDRTRNRFARLNARDVFLLTYFPALTLLAWCLPERLWYGQCVRLAKIQAWGKRAAARARLIARVLEGRAPAADAKRISTTLTARIHHARMQVLRCHRFGTWKPEVKLIGGEHVERALSAGRGAVLWVAQFVYSDLMTKVACHQRGLLATHLSRREHPISATRLGAKLLNPIWTSIESRYIAERVVMAPGQTAAALRELVRRVRANQLISITATAASGQQTYCVPFLNGTLRVAGGAPSLAQRSGAALLPVFTILDADGAFVTTIDPPISGPDGLDAEAAIQHLVTQWVARLETYVLHWPDQYAWYLAQVE